MDGQDKGGRDAYYIIHIACCRRGEEEAPFSFFRGGTFGRRFSPSLYGSGLVASRYPKARRFRGSSARGDAFFHLFQKADRLELLAAERNRAVDTGMREITGSGQSKKSWKWTYL